MLSTFLKAATVILFLLYIEGHLLQANQLIKFQKEATYYVKNFGLTNSLFIHFVQFILSEKSQLWYSLIRSKFYFTICKIKLL